MTRRIWAGLGLAAIAGAIVLLVVGSLEDNVVYFLTPSELQARGAEIHGEPLRLGGQVLAGSVEWDPQSRRLAFHVTDGSESVRVRSDGAPPAMFQEGEGVVVEGRYGPDGVFRSTNLMVKHSNEYAPPEEGDGPRETYRSLIRDEAGGDSTAAGPAPDGES